MGLSGDMSPILDTQIEGDDIHDDTNEDGEVLVAEAKYTPESEVPYD